MASEKTWQRGRPDAQALLVRARASRAIEIALVAHPPKDGRPWISPGSKHDPRLYIGKRPKSGSDRLTAFAEFMVERSSVETVSKWHRDFQGWLSGERTVSPDKLRVFASAIEASWLRLFWEVGYYQHLVVAIGKLLDESRFDEAGVLSAYVFQNWIPDLSLATHDESLAIHDMFANDGLFDRALLCVEKRLGFWPTVPARIEVGEIENDALRCVLRLCDPEDWQNMKDGALGYPCVPARRASVVLLRDLFPNEIDPFNPKALFEITNAIISSRSNDGK